MTQHNSSNSFDIIIIGGGSAGSLLAARLSSNPAIKILVLEAGKNLNEDANVRTIGLARSMLGNPSYDWQFKTSPEEGLNGRVIQQPRGRLWGGSSAINSYALVFPSRGYHDAWDTLLGGGNRETRIHWDWEGTKKYYKSFQTVQKPSEDIKRDLKIGGDFGGTEGAGSESIQASFPVTAHVLQKAWADAMQDLGFSHLKNPADGEIGGTTTTNTIDSLKGERSHAGVAFLEPVMKRENLVIRSNALVETILFGKNKRDGKLVATGVLYSEEGGSENTSVYARREVIICGGTFGSPKILELSGIGRQERLAAAGIECLLDLPGVGGELTFWIMMTFLTTSSDISNRKSSGPSELWSFRRGA